MDGCGSAQNGTGTDAEEYTLMSIDTIINGKVVASSTWNTQPSPPFCPPRNQIEHVLCWLSSLTQEGVFPGLIPILNSYLENMEVDVDTRCTILNYLKLIKKRASGMFDTFGHRFFFFLAFFSLVIRLSSSFQLGKTGGSCGCLVKCWIIGAKDLSVFSGLNLVQSNSDYKRFVIHFRT